MTAALHAESARNARLALVASAGLHLIVLLTFDLSPGAWQPGVQPAFRVALRTPPPEAQLALPEQPAAPVARPRRPEPALAPAPQPALPERGIDSSENRAGSSLPVAERYFRNSEVDVRAEPLSRPALVFPELPYVSKLPGTVTARVYIGADGSVDSVEILDVRPRRGVFEEAAIEALRQVRYKPAEIAGRPVRTQKLIEVSFSLDEKRAPAAD